jgi:propanol-preferring alcohol dehydrogenase
MKAQVLSLAALISTEPLHGAEVPLPEPDRGQVLIRVHACGVCRTDLHIVEGELPAKRLPSIPGHQAVGTVVRVGPDVVNPEVGARVGVPWLHKTCGACAFCLRGEENLCPEAAFTGWDSDGGYADYMVAEADYVTPIPQRYSNVDRKSVV